jgi:hypothetical protein
MTTRFHVTMVACSVLVLTAPLSFAQSAFDKEIGTDVNALVEKVDFDMSGWGKVDGLKSGKGQIPYLGALGHPPKRVALVSFYAYDPGNTKGFGSPYFGGRSETTRQLTSDGAGAVATLLHDQGIGALKEALGAYGMQLLTPDEFLDTDAKRELYEDFVLDLGIGAKFAQATEGSGKENKLNKASRLSVVAPGYRLFRLVYGENIRPMQQGDKKISKSLGYDLAKDLGVDATLVICNYCKATKKEGALEGVYFYLFGPNGVAGDMEAFTYWPGHLYVGLRLDKLGITMLEFGKEEKKSTSYSGGTGDFRSDSLREAGIVSADFAGYERILTALGKKAGIFMQERTTKPHD